MMNDFFEGFSNWIDSKHGKDTWQAIDDVLLSLEGAEVDIDERKIIWTDGDKLTIDESAEKIGHTSEIEIETLKHHILLWLQMEYVPKELNQAQMEIFEEKILEWVDPHLYDNA